MKKLWSIFLLLLVCNITSLLVLANGENEYSIQQTVCCISQQQTLPSLDTTPDFTLQQPESVAVAVSRTDSAESSVTAKTSTSNNSKFSHSEQRKYLNFNHVALIIHNYTVIGFSRAIDHYIYAFRHIII